MALENSSIMWGTTWMRQKEREIKVRHMIQKALRLFRRLPGDVVRTSTTSRKQATIRVLFCEKGTFGNRWQLTPTVSDSELNREHNFLEFP